MWIIIFTSKRSHDNQHMPVAVEDGYENYPRPQLNFLWFSTSMGCVPYENQKGDHITQSAQDPGVGQPFRWFYDEHGVHLLRIKVEDKWGILPYCNFRSCCLHYNYKWTCFGSFFLMHTVADFCYRYFTHTTPAVGFRSRCITTSGRIPWPLCPSSAVASTMLAVRAGGGVEVTVVDKMVQSLLEAVW